MTIDSPSVISRMFWSSPWLAGPITRRCRRIAEAEENQRQRDHRGIGIDARLERQIGREHRRAQNRAMGEVDDVQHAIDQRQPDRDQRIDRPGHQPVEHGGSEYVGRVMEATALQAWLSMCGKNGTGAIQRASNMRTSALPRWLPAGDPQPSSASRRQLLTVRALNSIMANCQRPEPARNAVGTITPGPGTPAWRRQSSTGRSP